MAISFSGEQTIPARREEVWKLLNDPEHLKRCLPGCEDLAQDEDGGFAAVVVTKVGPIKARFQGRLSIRDASPPESYSLVGEGVGGVAGHVRGVASVRLDAVSPDSTLLGYTVEAHVAGRLAQLGGRLIKGVAMKHAETFFARMEEGIRQQESR